MLARLAKNLAGWVVAGVLAFWWHLPPACTDANAARYSGEEMWDWAIRNKTFIKTDLPEAACWFEKSADAGYLSAYSSMGLAYQKGRGVKKSLPKAMAWYEAGTGKGHDSSAYLLGKLYLEGEKVPKDIAKGRTYIELAAKRGHSGAVKQVATWNANGIPAS